MSEAAVQTESTPTPSPAVVESTPAPAVETTPAPETNKAPDLDTGLRQIWEKNNPERDQSGRFLKRDEAQPQDGTTEITAQSNEKGVEQETPAIDVPNSWVADKRELWSSIPPKAQEYLAQREKEAHEAISRFGQERKSYEPIQQTLEQFRDVYERNGLAPHDAISRMFAVEQWLASDAPTAIKGLAEAYGVDLSKVASGEAPPPENRMIAELNGKVSQLQSILTAQQRHQQNEAQAVLAREIAEFSKDKPHFEAVKKVMAGLLQSEAAASLQDAYEQATRAVPDIWKQLQSEQQKKDQEASTKKAVEQAQAAKKSASVNVKSNLAVHEPGKTMDDTLREIAAKHYGRAKGI